jgi:hypothetical protein
MLLTRALRGGCLKPTSDSKLFPDPCMAVRLSKQKRTQRVFAFLSAARRLSARLARQGALSP